MTQRFAHLFLSSLVALHLIGCASTRYVRFNDPVGDDHTPNLATLGEPDEARYTHDLRELLWVEAYRLPNISVASSSRGDGADFPIAYGLYADPTKQRKLDEPDTQHLARLWRLLAFRRCDPPKQFLPRYGFELVGRASDCICTVSLTADGHFAYIFPCDAPAKPFFVILDPDSLATQRFMKHVRHLLIKSRNVA